MANKASRDIICAECPNIYSEYDIMCTRGDEARPLVEILGSTIVAEENDNRRTKGRAFRRLLGRESDLGGTYSKLAASSAGNLQREKLRNFARLKDWTFKCPNGHIVDGNRGYQIPLAVVGSSGSSKSHFLPGMIWETSLLRGLSPFGVTLRVGQFTSSQLSYFVTQLYEEKKILPPTPPDKVAGPYGYRLSIRHNAEDVGYSLLLFDVGGEALSSIVKISEQAAFVLLARAIIVLIDPQEVVSTAFDAVGAGMDQRQRIIAAAKVRDSIGLVADALEILWDMPMKQVPIPVCFVVAKADCLSWSYDWGAETSTVIEGVKEGRDLRTLLLSCSDRVRNEFDAFGGRLIIEEIDDRFSRDRVRFAAASATSEMPVNGAWENPTPIGISLTLLHLLDMLGRISINSPNADPDTLEFDMKNPESLA